MDEGVEEVAVVRDDEHGAGVADEGALEHALGLHVEVVGGLVEDQKVGGLDEHADECDARAFATGKDADFFKDIVAAEEEAAEKVAALWRGFAGGGFFYGLEDGLVGIEFIGVVLGEVGEGDAESEGEFAIGRGILAGDEAAEGGFAGAVGADDGVFFAFGDLEVEVFEDGVVAEAFAGAFELGDGVAGGGWRGEAEVDDGVFGLDDDAFDFGELFDAGLDESGFVGGGAEAIDELLGFGDFFLLGFVGAEEVFAAQDAFFFEVGVVSGVFFGAALMEGDGAGAEGIEQ